MILILSAETDLHVRQVVSKLDGSGHQYCILDPSSFPSSMTCHVAFSSKNFEYRLITDSMSLSLSDVQSVWIRRPGKPSLSDRLSEGESRWLRGECTELFDSLWANLNALWISEPAKIKEANHKLLQLKTARRLNMKIPRFLITNSPPEALNFIKSCRDGAIVKALSTPAIVSSEKCATLYTHLITEADLAQINSVRFGPNFFQEFIPKKLDIRVTVVGAKLFAVGIDSTSDKSNRVDFRRAELFHTPHAPIELPQQLKSACINLVQQLGLRFGAIDLLLAEDGEYYFLEVNPNGQWLWLEWMTEVPISRAICDLLISPYTRAH
jgi:glutathione synthase/RimK-type ligase-like ATP-grasp enzyme